MGEKDKYFMSFNYNTKTKSGFANGSFEMEKGVAVTMKCLEGICEGIKEDQMMDSVIVLFYKKMEV